MKTIAVVGALDTKGEENMYLINQLKKNGVDTIMIDLSHGPQAELVFVSDVTASEVSLAGGCELEKLKKEKDRDKCLKIMSKGAAKIIDNLQVNGHIDGVISMGGGQGTYMACEVMRSLPIGFPKLIISTIVCLDDTMVFFEGINDTMLINPMVDISGLNSVMKMIVDKAVGAIIGMVNSNYEKHLIPKEDVLRIGISMWGVTTPCVEMIRRKLDEKGYEVYIFHANGMGGRIMENYITQGFLHGIVDVTLSEVSNPIGGGYYPVVKNRLESAGKYGIPQIVSVGGMDMLKVYPPFDSLPEKFKGRQKYFHNKNLLFVRSNSEDNVKFGKVIAKKLNKANGITKVVLPLKGISAVDYDGGPLYCPKANKALFCSIKENLNSNIEVIEKDMHINDPEFAAVIAGMMVEIMGEKYK